MSPEQITRMKEGNPIFRRYGRYGRYGRHNHYDDDY